MTNRIIIIMCFLITGFSWGAAAAADVPDIGLVLVKGGCYRMGDTLRDVQSDEKPVHDVCVNDFYIGKFEVTQAQWEAVMGNNPSVNRDCGPDCPVENVNWDDVQAFIAKYNEKTGNKCRLPTEAEWEFSARGGGKKDNWAGTNEPGNLEQYAWFDRNSEGKLHPVGQKKPNELGIYDMTGGVWEFVEDKYGEFFYTKSPKDNPQGPESGDARVVRGGSWRDSGEDMRNSYRGAVWAGDLGIAFSRALCEPEGSGTGGYKFDDLGFRLVCEKAAKK
ncbi:MAG: SUMF1/EgtB/PvdO family nonheme iron enzyme [Nitrospirae bacterium]|nr:SUMF1/EgtB/PvdO family nonheme iron enzyme [Nitrospirota bacterium]